MTKGIKISVSHPTGFSRKSSACFQKCKLLDVIEALRIEKAQKNVNEFNSVNMYN